MSLVCNKMVLVLSAGLAVSLTFSFLVMPLNRFRANRFYGAVLVIIYVVFLTVCIVFEFTVMKNGNENCF